MSATPPSLPPDYRRWLDHARSLLTPLAALMVPGQAHLSINGPGSDHDAHADRLESFSRPLLLAALFLQAHARPEDAELRARIAHWFRSALILGTDPASPAYFGPDANYHQHHVEMGLLAIGLQIGEAELWAPLTPPERAQIARWLGTARGSGIVNNNHLFMSVHILEFLGRQGYAHPSDAAVVETHLHQLETMHRGGGWFEDGINQAFDHYNAYAFHFYGLMWARFHGHHQPERAARWRAWASLFVEDYQHFFAASGEHPAFGRSLMYRFNAINVFGLAADAGCTDLPLGRLRRLCTRSLDFFLSRPITQEQGCLAFGWTDAFDALAEPYSCAASPYWCAKGFAALLMPPSHPFWTETESPLPAEQGDFTRAIPAAGLLVRGVGGEVELLNTGSMVGNTQLRYGAWKWSKTAYRTGVGFTLSDGPPATDWSLDSALTIQLDDGRRFGRHSTITTAMEDGHVGYVHNLGAKTGQVNTFVETHVWWRGGWLLQVHRLDAQQPVVCRLGGYALPLSEPCAVPAASGDRLALWSNCGRGTVLQPLTGFAATEWSARRAPSEPRRHIAAPFHATPVARSLRFTGHHTVAALVWTGKNASEAVSWSLDATSAGAWRLHHHHLGDWCVAHPVLPALP